MVLFVSGEKEKTALLKALLLCYSDMEDGPYTEAILRLISRVEDCLEKQDKQDK